MYPLRVFISYSSKDSALAESLDHKLRDLDLIPVWSRYIQGGQKFPDVIREQIATAHVFMPIVTLDAVLSEWVQQEAGYALASGIPVLPLEINGARLGGFFRDTQALAVKADFSDLEAQLASNQFDFEAFAARMPSTGDESGRMVAYSPQDRTQVLSEQSTRLAHDGRYGRVRQAALFSSFSLPDRPASDPSWQTAYPRIDDFFRGKLADERRALTRHVEQCGCSLLLYPFIPPGNDGPNAHRAQIGVLIEFLERHATNDKVSIILVTDQRLPGNVTLVGDWLSAHTVAPRPDVVGYELTVFERRGPTVFRHVRAFDEDFARAASTSRHTTVSRAIDALRDRRATLA